MPKRYVFAALLVVTSSSAAAATCESIRAEIEILTECKDGTVSVGGDCKR